MHIITSVNVIEQGLGLVGWVTFKLSSPNQPDTKPCTVNTIHVIQLF